MNVFPRARTGKVTYMNDRGRMIASLVGGITYVQQWKEGNQVMMKILDGDVVREDRVRRTRRLAEGWRSIGC